MRYIQCLLVLALVLTSQTASADTQKWKIGVLAPLSGDVMAWGQDTQRAVQLANEMLGNGQFELVFEDDLCVGKNAATGAQKLINVDHVNFGMIVCTESTLSAAPIFERSKVVVVAPGATGAAISSAGDYIFRTWPSDAKMVEVVFDYVLANFKRPAALTESRAFPQEFTRVFLKLATQHSLPVVSEDFATGETDFRSLLLKLRAKNPDVLVLSSDSERTLLAVVKQVQNLKWKVPLVGQYIAGTPGFYEKAGEAAEGFVFGDAPAMTCQSAQPECAVFNEFIRRYGRAQSSDYMVGSTIASFMAIAQAARSGEPPKDHLYKAQFDSPMGKISFDANGDIVGPKHTLKIIEQGKPKLLPATR